MYLSKDIEDGGRDVSLIEGGQQAGVIHHIAASHVDEHGLALQ